MSEQQEKTFCGLNHDQMYKVLETMCEIGDTVDLTVMERNSYDVAVQCVTEILKMMVNAQHGITWNGDEPPAQTKPGGRWIHSQTSGRSMRFMCSVCKSTVYYPQHCCMKKNETFHLLIPYRFCPFCASPMQPVEPPSKGGKQ